MFGRHGRRGAQPGTLLAVALGGALGAPARYGVARLLPAGRDAFPWATFWTNLSGAFVLGLFLTLVLERFPPSRHARSFFAIGFLGAYTTFSTMAVETVLLAKDGHTGLGVLYLAGSIAAGIASAYAGIACGRAAPASRRGTSRPEGVT